MAKFHDLWHEMTAPHSPNEDEAIIEFITKAILVILGSILLISTIPLIIGWGIIEFDLYTLSIIFFLDALIIAAYWISRRGHWRLASNVPPFLFLILGVSLSFEGGLITTGFLFYFTAIVLAGFLQGSRAQWLLLLISVLAHLSIAATRQQYVLEELAAIGIMIAATYTGVTLLQQLFIRQFRNSLARARSSEERIRTLFDGVPVGLYRTTPDGNILDINPALLDMLGYPDKQSLLAKKATDIYIDAADREHFWVNLQNRDSIQGFEMQLRRSDGSVIWVKDTVRAIKEASGRVVFAEGSLEDITDRVRAEETMRRQLDELRILHAVAKAGTESVDEDALIENVTQILSESFYPDHLGVLLFDEEFARLRVHPSFRGIDEKYFQTTIPLDESISGTVARTGKPLRIPDVTMVPNFLQVTPGMSSELCVPLQVDGRIIGVLNAEARQIDAFSPSDERFLMTAAGQLATAIEKLRLLNTTRRRLEYLSALRRIDQAITAYLDLRPVLGVLLDQVTAQLGIDAAVFRLYSPFTRDLKFTAQRGLPANASETVHLQIGKGYAGRAAFERQVIHVEDLREPGQGLAPGELVGAEGFISYFAVPLIAKGQVKGVLELLHRSSFEPDKDWLGFLDALATQAAIAIDNAELFVGLQKANFELIDAYDSTIEGWSRALDLRDKETEGHSQRVTELTLHLARIMGMGEEDLVHVRRGALLHDIGKMGIPDHILLKPGPLTEEEWDVMRRHPVYAYELLAPIAHLRPAIDIPYSHHEKWDGSGYPLGLKGEQIPLAARIFALVDVWDALRSDRPYRPAWSDEQALEYIQTAAGAHFDPQVVQTFLIDLRSFGN